MTTTTMTADTTATLATLWASIKNRRTGLYGCRTVREECAALLSTHSMPDAIAYAERFCNARFGGCLLR